MTASEATDAKTVRQPHFRLIRIAANRRLREDNEILRKASIFLAGELDPRNG